jgi:hypothetical protein
MHETHANAAKEMQIVHDSSYHSPSSGFWFDQSRMVLMSFPPHLVHLSFNPMSGTGVPSGQPFTLMNASCPQLGL